MKERVYYVKRNSELIDRKVIDDIKAELHEKADFLQTKPEISYDSAFADGLECAVTIIERRLWGDEE